MATPIRQMVYDTDDKAALFLSGDEQQSGDFGGR
jgi:hypothetical protein